jgi:hypothetical protein
VISRKTKFEKMTIQMDGCTFIDCEFTDCILRYDGTMPVHLSGSLNFVQCRFQFEGPAKNALQLLATMYQAGDALKGVVEETFSAIRGEKNSGSVLH